MNKISEIYNVFCKLCFEDRGKGCAFIRGKILWGDLMIFMDELHKKVNLHKKDILSQKSILIKKGVSLIEVLLTVSFAGIIILAIAGLLTLNTRVTWGTQSNIRIQGDMRAASMTIDDRVRNASEVQIIGPSDMGTAPGWNYIGVGPWQIGGVTREALLHHRWEGTDPFDPTVGSWRTTVLIYPDTHSNFDIEFALPNSEAYSRDNILNFLITGTDPLSNGIERGRIDADITALNSLEVEDVTGNRRSTAIAYRIEGRVPNANLAVYTPEAPPSLEPTTSPGVPTSPPPPTSPPTPPPPGPSPSPGSGFEVIFNAQFVDGRRTVGFGTPLPPPQRVPSGGTATLPTEIPLIYYNNSPSYRYRFAYWYIMEGGFRRRWDFATDVVTEDILLRARFQYLVRFDAMGGSPTPPNQWIFPGYRVIRPPVDPSPPSDRPNYVLGYWYVSTFVNNIFHHNNWDFPWNFPGNNPGRGMNFHGQMNPEGNIHQGTFILRAFWKPPGTTVYTMVFDMNGGHNPNWPGLPAGNQYVYSGGRVRSPFDPSTGQPFEPVRAGHTFTHWYIMQNGVQIPWNFATDVITDNMELSSPTAFRIIRFYANFVPN